ncbi:cx9C motif-containing protein 4 [Geospiza fortis]|uniref:Cx9C motif-containing protein 4 n=1 Tax=Geospiza fortis TaxID=48883 RepID=A0A8N5HX64_GEOFO|nr:cx9C motif-containing protein 4 [Geospiza fortis]
MVLKNCCLNSCLGINLFLNMSRKDPCQKQACEIQKCLQVNNYVESKCEAALQEMRKCCARFTKGRSICCSGFEREEEEREKAKLTSKGISPACSSLQIWCLLFFQ